MSSLNTSVTAIEATVNTCLLQAEPKVGNLQPNSVVHHGNIEEKLIERWNTCKIVSVETGEMETNLNKVLNQSVRHQLNGLLCKYTNVMKGK